MIRTSELSRRMQRAGLERQRGHGHGVLEQPAEIGVVAAARARGGAQRGPEVLVGQEGVEQPPQIAVVHLARQVLEEAVELLDVAEGDGQEVGRVEARLPPPARMSSTSTWSSSRKRSTRPVTRTRSPRSKRPARKSALRNARAGIAAAAVAQLEREVGGAAARRQAILARAGEHAVDLAVPARSSATVVRGGRWSATDHILGARPDRTRCCAPIPWGW